jgi:hypothetical protein
MISHEILEHEVTIPICPMDYSGFLEVKYISEQQTIREGRLKYEIWVFIHRLNMADHVICPQYDMDEEQAEGL